MMSLKFASKQEKTLYYTTDKMNLFSTYDTQSINKANSGRFLCGTQYMLILVSELELFSRFSLESQLTRIELMR